MICRNCGDVMDENARFCPNCGTPQQQSQQPETASVLNPQHFHAEDCSHAENSKVGFLQAVKLFFTNYTNFRGRSRRSEYWWFCLFNLIVSFVIVLIAPDISGLWSVVILVPSLSLVVRRLHDIGKSGWWYLIALIPLVGGILLVIWFCKDSEPHTNQWGPSPKY